METKHDQILKYIENLGIGSRLSVRLVAKQLNVSEGTAYRAIKDAENSGLVSTVERVGTVRVEEKRRQSLEKLTFGSVARIVDGQVIGGAAGLGRTLNHFVIGAMELDAMKRYIGEGDLLIAGNREAVHRYALQEGAAVLVTGGFAVDKHIGELADRLELPVISTSYDTFTVATKINRAIYDQMIKKEIVHVSDILIPVDRTNFIFEDEPLTTWHRLNRETAHGRYPIVNRQMKVVGIVAMTDVMNHPEAALISQVMTVNPLVINPEATAASAAHRMIWEDIECLPVVDRNHDLLGVITRSDVLRALQLIQQQPQVGQTIEDLIAASLVDCPPEDDHADLFRFAVTPQMTDHLGSLSYGMMTSILANAARRTLGKRRKGDLVAENLVFYFFKPVQIEQTVSVRVTMLEITRRNGKFDFELLVDGQLCGKALLTAQFIARF
ncbi:MAG: DRTGG domain-containing protein [Sporolactobacillus sp.]